jgi:predicted methyltransferase
MTQVIQGDSLEVLRTLPDESVQMCVTSPPRRDPPGTKEIRRKGKEA